MTGRQIEGFGVELEKIEYKSLFNWFVSFEDPVNLYRAHPAYFYCQAVFLLGAAIITIHCSWKGGRWPYLFAAAIGNGLTVEVASYLIPHIDNFWLGLTPVMFFGHRLPLYIIFYYPVFYYHASWAVSKLKLRCGLVEHLAVGILLVLIDLPYDIIGTKFVYWMWHDTDPNVADRSYWVPWTSYYFHASFAAFWSLIFHTSRKWFTGKSLPKWEVGPIKGEIASVILAALLGMPGGCFIFLIIYHPFHDVFGVHTEVATVALLATFMVIVWKFDRNSLRNGIVEKIRLPDRALLIHLMLHYLTFLGTAIFFNPEDQISMGMHQPIGDCSKTVPVETILKTLTKKEFLCAKDYDEKYYDFHCLPDKKLPKDGSIWYTVCGTPFENRVEYILVLSLITFVAFIVFSSIHFDGKQEVADDMKSSRDIKKKKPKVQ